MSYYSLTAHGLGPATLEVLGGCFHFVVGIVVVVAKFVVRAAATAVFGHPFLAFAVYAHQRWIRDLQKKYMKSWVRGAIGEYLIPNKSNTKDTAATHGVVGLTTT